MWLTSWTIGLTSKNGWGETPISKEIIMQQLSSNEPNPNPGLARNTDPETSHDAAESIDTTALEQIVYNVIKQFPNGCIGDDVVKMLPQFGIQTISPRYAPLIRKGWVIDTGEKRQARSGRGQRVMKVVKKEDYEQQRLFS